ncbi:MAG TPA: hypothetical protein VGL61_06580 [Kofleriaceae bacterium]
MTIPEAIDIVSDGSHVVSPQRDKGGKLTHLVITRRDGAPLIQVFGHPDHGQHMVIIHGDDAELQRVIDAARR